MKNIWLNVTPLLKSVLVSGLLAVTTLSGCTNTDSLQPISNHSSGFYGSINDHGELFTQQSIPAKAFESQLNCTDKDQFSAPLNYRVDKPILSSSPSQTPLPANINPSRHALPRPGRLSSLPEE